MATVTLKPDQERFAAEAVAGGRFRDVDGVVEASLTLLQRAEAERAAFVASLEAAEAESACGGFVAAADIHREMSAFIEEMGRTET